MMMIPIKGKGKQRALVLLALGALVSTSAQAALPAQIVFSNETPLALATAIAGLPGQGVAPNAEKSASYAIVSLGCYYSGNMGNCPIEFTNRENGERVATVYINAETATLTQPPVLHGNYATEYQVTGWEESPIQHIYITKRFGFIA